MLRSHTKAIRLSEIPKLLELKPRTTKELAEHFGVAQRAIQRDLQMLTACSFQFLFIPLAYTCSFWDTP